MSNAKEFKINKTGVLTEYNGSGGDVVIPDGVTSIGRAAFWECKNLTSIVIPDSVTSIGDLVFCGCKNLTSIVIPDSVTSIGDSAFAGCKKLCDAKGFFIVRDVLVAYNGPGGNVVIPDSVTSIGNEAFYCCKKLKSIVIPNSVTSIGDSAFAGCVNLKRITIPTRVGSVLKKAFPEYPINCHYSDDLRIDIPDLSVLPQKFRLHAALCFVEDGGKPGDTRFVSHGKYLKANAGKLAETAAKVPALLAFLCREKWIKAKDVETFLVAVQQTGNTEAIAMVLDYQSNSLTKKEKENATKKKEKQENIVFDRAVARMNQEGIAGLNFVVTGDLETFENRNELKAYIEQQGGKLQSSMSAKTDYLITNDSDSQTEKKRKAAELGIDILTERQFNDKAGRSFCMEQCGKLFRYIGSGGNVLIPEGVTSIGNGAFEDCKNLTSIVIPEGVTSIGKWAFRYCENLTSIVIPDGVTSIGDYAFSSCYNLSSIVMPNSVTSIGEDAFSRCKSLTSIVIPDGVISIGNGAFEDCKNLTSVVIPEGVTSIGGWVFFKCKSLTIHASAGSHAKTYAEENKIPFVEL